jgi:hypothetical protein
MARGYAALVRVRRRPLTACCWPARSRRSGDGDSGSQVALVGMTRLYHVRPRRSLPRPGDLARDRAQARQSRETQGKASWPERRHSRHLASAQALVPALHMPGVPARRPVSPLPIVRGGVSLPLSYNLVAPRPSATSVAGESRPARRADGASLRIRPGPAPPMQRRGSRSIPAPGSPPSPCMPACDLRHHAAGLPASPALMTATAPT